MSPTFGVGRIHTLFMYPMTFDEFLNANNENGLISMKKQADSQHPLDAAFHEKLIEYFRIYLVGRWNARGCAGMDKDTQLQPM